jgi:hypothetical protein
MLENLQAAAQVKSKQKVTPAIEFDGQEGTAVTPGYDAEPENFDEFLIDAGLDPTDIEVIPPVRTSRWQQQKDGELVWLTSYRFTFRRRKGDIDLPLIMANARQKAKKPTPHAADETALVVLWSDLQLGKVDILGGTPELLERIEMTKARLAELVKREKPSQVIFADLGDTVENFQNTAAQQQLATNDLSIMEQVDLATSLAWDHVRWLAEKVPKVTYASVGSNHCQWRSASGKPIGKATDDWGVFIGRQLARLAAETGHDHIKFLEPQPHHESLAVDVFEDGFHLLGIVHGHQVSRPDRMPTWWRQQAFGAQPVADASILVHGHFHHLRIQEMGSVDRGEKAASRFLIQAPTMDNGSSWFRRFSGEDSQPGLAAFTLERGTDFTGTVHKL